MAYTVLARKYRSQTFDDVIGQDPIAQTLKNAIETGRVAHAYLFSGTRGVGKTTMARILAKALNCLKADGPTTKPCCKCESCVAINTGDDIDVIEIDGASNNRVEEVRELRENAIYRPARARHKIYIIDEVHMLTTSAFNALLKILEEPPSHVKFIFATTEPNKVIATIQSRCQRFDFRNITPQMIAQQLKTILKKEKIKYDDDLILPLAKMANGSMRDGLSLLDRLISTGQQPLTASALEEFLGCPNSQKVHNLVSCIGDSDGAGTLAAIDDLITGGISEVQIVDALIDHMRDLMVVKSAGADSELLILTDQQRENAAALAEKFDIASLVYSISTLEKIRWSVRNSDTARVLLEASLLRFALSEHFMNVDQLLSRSAQSPAPTPVKKNVQLSTAKASAPAPVPSTASAAVEPVPSSPPAASKPPQVPPVAPGKVPSISNWSEILDLIDTRLGGATAAMLHIAMPSRFEDGVLTVQFPATAGTQMQMCRRNGRPEQIESLLSEHLSQPVKINFELAAPDQSNAEPEAAPAKTIGQKRNELINDPAVRTVLAGLDAIVTGIEENEQ
jgi:DNA polymerase-3 subunit gamma/tau